MKERPILFSAPMVRALLAGTKTQTRRAAKLPHMNPLGKWEATTFGGPGGGRTARGEEVPLHAAIWHTRTGESFAHPRGVVGDRLWVREAWRTEPTFDGLPPRELDSAMAPVQYEAGPHADVLGGKLRPSMFMPRWACRLALTLTHVRAERLNDISRGDAMAEGCPFPNMAKGPDPRQWYADLWEQINGAGSWSANPWVWVAGFQTRAAEPSNV